MILYLFKEVDKKYHLSFCGENYDIKIKVYPSASIQVVNINGNLNYKTIIIDDISERTTPDEIFKKIKNKLKLSKVFISLQFPRDNVVNACIFDDISCYKEDEDSTIYSMCCYDYVLVYMKIIPFEEMIFDITVNVENKYTITLNDIRGSQTISDIFMLMREKIEIEKKYVYMKIKDRIYGEEKKILDIVTVANMDSILRNENLEKFPVFWNVELKECIHSQVPIKRYGTISDVPRRITTSLALDYFDSLFS